MMSYKFKRRSFLRGIGGAVGLKTMLSNVEASAQGAKSPPRLLITHWPVGTVPPDFIPTPSTDPAIPSNVNSPILMPFATAGLGGDMTVLFGVTTSRLPTNGGGGHEGGTVVMMTGVGAPGTRAGETEGDDAFAGGPSMDQIFLKNVTALQQKGNKAANGFENAICDSRVDFAEVSTQCLSYGYATTSVTPVSGTIRVQNSPQLPTLRPLDLYTNLFGSFMAPTGGGLTAAMIKALKERKSVLDFALRELNQLETLAPASERSKIEIHAQAIRDIETQISNQLNGTGGGPAMGCVAPAMPPPVSGGAADKANHNDYNNPKTTMADDTLHAQIGGLHMGIIKAAFVCDIIRVATFQWSPGTNHVAFQNLFPGETGTIYMHHPESHKIGSPDVVVSRDKSQPDRRVLVECSELVQPADGDDPGGLEDHHRRHGWKPVRQHDHPVCHRGRGDRSRAREHAGHAVRRQGAGLQAGPVSGWADAARWLSNAPLWPPTPSLASGSIVRSTISG